MNLPVDTTANAILLNRLQTQYLEVFQDDKFFNGYNPSKKRDNSVEGVVEKLVWVVGCAVAQSMLTPQPDPTTDLPPILSYVSEDHHNGSYKFSYVTSNNISIEQEGYVQEVNENKTVYASRGSYSYVDPNGELVTVVWYADDTGFHAYGNNIPTEDPPITQRPGTLWSG